MLPLYAMNWAKSGVKYLLVFFIDVLELLKNPASQTQQSEAVRHFPVTYGFD